MSWGNPFLVQERGFPTPHPQRTPCVAAPVGRRFVPLSIVARADSAETIIIVGSCPAISLGCCASEGVSGSFPEALPVLGRFLEGIDLGTFQANGFRHRERDRAFLFASDHVGLKQSQGSVEFRPVYADTRLGTAVVIPKMGATAAFDPAAIRTNEKMRDTGQSANHGAVLIEEAPSACIQRTHRIAVIVAPGVALLGFKHGTAPCHNRVPIRGLQSHEAFS
jgi:hypothetical protein